MPPDLLSPVPLTLRRIDPSRNMARFYSLSVEPTLFGDPALVIEWGRIGTIGRRRLRLCPDLEAAVNAWRRIEKSKRQRGYRDI